MKPARPVGDRLWTDDIGKIITFAVDCKGNRWTWRCGWWHVDSRGRVKNQKRPLGHAEFRRKVKLLSLSSPASREVLHGTDRPNRHWRRLVDRELYTHDQFGNCYMLATDGCHAIIETMLGERKNVCFENLSEFSGVSLPPRVKKDSAPKATAKAKRKSAVLELMNKYIQSK